MTAGTLRVDGQLVAHLQARICDVANSLVAEAAKPPAPGGAKKLGSSLTRSLPEWQHGARRSSEQEGSNGPDFDGLVLAYEGVAEFLAQYPDVSSMMLQLYRWMYSAEQEQEGQEQEGQEQGQQEQGQQ